LSTSRKFAGSRIIADCRFLIADFFQQDRFVSSSQQKPRQMTQYSNSQSAIGNQKSAIGNSFDCPNLQIYPNCPAEVFFTPILA